MARAAGLSRDEWVTLRPALEAEAERLVIRHAATSGGVADALRQRRSPSGVDVDALVGGLGAAPLPGHHMPLARATRRSRAVGRQDCRSDLF